MAISVNENGAVKVIANQGAGKSIFWYIPDGTTWAQLTDVEYQYQKSMLIDSIDLDAVPNIVRVSAFGSHNILSPSTYTSGITMTGSSVRYYFLTKDFRPNIMIPDGTNMSYINSSYPEFWLHFTGSNSAVYLWFAIRDHYFDIYVYGTISANTMPTGQFQAPSSYTHGFLIEPLA